MVELRLEPLDGELQKDYYVSVRVGEVQKLSRVNPSRGYKFPQAAIGERKFGKIEIFKKVGACSVGIIPESGVDQEVRVDLEDKSNVRFRVLLNGDQPAKPPPANVEDKPAAKVLNPKVTAAKAYLESHNLEMRLSEAMQAVLREKPEDPAAFVAEILKKSAGSVQKKAKAPEAGTAAPKQASTASVSEVVPVSAYIDANVKIAPQRAFDSIYAMFPKSAGAAAAPAAAAPAAAAAAPALIPVAAPPPGYQDTAAFRPGTVEDGRTQRADVDIGQKWSCKPSVGTWAGHLRGPKLPRSAAGAS